MPRNDLKSVNRLSISSAVRDEINYDLSIQDALARDYVNVSALARMLQPRIQERIGRKPNEESVITSLKRLRGIYSPASKEIGKVVAGSVVNVRTHVSKMSVEKTKKTLQTVSAMLSSHQEDFLQVSESLSSITLIFDQRLHKKVKAELSNADILEEGDDYAAIIVQSPREIIATPGCVITFYNQLARRHVNMEDTVSCHTDTIIVVRMKDVGRAFDALTDLISEESRRLEK
ncbi:MAG: ACT domain-containing protein [Thaumarchaeota archaeon]|nr:ACT domain-containing protein [Nitrososphaerota archaeon]